MLKLRLLQVALLAGVLAAGSAAAETVRLSASLQPSSEVPPRRPRVRARSTPRTTRPPIRCSGRSLTNTSRGRPPPRSFHGPAPVGQNAGVQVPIPKDELASPIKGSKELTDAQVTDLMGGKWYFNVHTKEHPAGEIRGQVMPAN